MCILSIYIHMCIWPFNAPNWPFNALFLQNGALKGQIGAAKGLVKLPSAARAAMPIEVEFSWNFIWNLISLVLVIAWIGFAVRAWQAYDAPVQVAGDCFISTVGKDWAAGCIVGGGVSSQSAVSWKNLACFYSHFCQVLNVKVVDAIHAKWIQVRKVPARPRPVQEDSFAVFFAGWDSCFLASHERSWQPESLFTTSESEAKEAEKCQGCFGWIQSPKLSVMFLGQWVAN